ncbi:MAG TPA: hypothetical protein DD379_12715 [Cyanobacteria bacterium UBA11162]|nr:hypothetical protein [Cyanobacteria bacterium UBA12227]HAX86880.1 hypothetical protein [Cyanobacteria bacterium UBA11370]HBL12247.1 hypothetical protein [Cyanobacteria bacterium UBA11162]HBY79846.1 hypothetical protein [Cyanobacteria bacterium UBA11148]
MKLTYRGIQYDYNPATVETVEPGFGGKYRGLDWRFRNLKKPPVLQPSVNLTYRGVRYQTPGVVANNSDEQAKVPVLLSMQDKARSLMLDRQKALKNRQLSMLNRSAAEVGLPAVQHC